MIRKRNVKGTESEEGQRVQGGYNRGEIRKQRTGKEIQEKEKKNREE